MFDGVEVKCSKPGHYFQKCNIERTLFKTNLFALSLLLISILKIYFADSKLKIKAHSSTAGSYSCQAENEVGRSNRQEVVQVYVEEKPQVTIYFEPRQPVSEVADANVTLMCSSNYNRNVLKNANVITGSNFISVKWYLDGDLLKQVDRPPECLVPKNATSNKCHVDPSKVMLLNVNRSFRGNYSCQAHNRAGWGPISEAKDMKVYFPPEGTSINVSPSKVIKGKPFEVRQFLKC